MTRFARTRRRLPILLPVCVAAALSGCVDKGNERETPAYSEMPNKCADSMESARGTIARFAGSLYIPDQRPVESPSFEMEAKMDRLGGTRSQSCDVEYKHSGRRFELPDGAPEKRAIYLFYHLHIDSPDPVGAAKDSMRVSAKVNSPSESPFTHQISVADLGEDALSYWNGISDSANIEFRISNLYVHVLITGRDKSKDVTDPLTAELRAQLEDSAAPIAREIAAGLRTH